MSDTACQFCGQSHNFEHTIVERGPVVYGESVARCTHGRHPGWCNEGVCADEDGTTTATVSNTATVASKDCGTDAIHCTLKGCWHDE